MHYYNDGSDGFVWDPLWRKRTGLTPCEQQVVMHPAVRRLQELAHRGAAARILPFTHTRYMHTLGVYTLVAHFRPERALGADRRTTHPANEAVKGVHVAFMGLTVHETEPPDAQGVAVVVFTADYKMGVRFGSLTERSEFVQLDGKWVYLRGAAPDGSVL